MSPVEILVYLEVVPEGELVRVGIAFSFQASHGDRAHIKSLPNDLVKLLDLETRGVEYVEDPEAPAGGKLVVDPLDTERGTGGRGLGQPNVEATRMLNGTDGVRGNTVQLGNALKDVAIVVSTRFATTSSLDHMKKEWFVLLKREVNEPLEGCEERKSLGGHIGTV